MFAVSLGKSELLPKPLNLMKSSGELIIDEPTSIFSINSIEIKFSVLRDDKFSEVFYSNLQENRWVLNN